jgi:hypothetical protein
LAALLVSIAIDVGTLGAWALVGMVLLFAGIPLYGSL